MKFALTACMALGLQVMATTAQAETKTDPRSEPASAAEPKVLNKPATMNIAPVQEPSAQAAPMQAGATSSAAVPSAKAAEPVVADKSSSVEKTAEGTKPASETADAKDVTVAKKLAPPPKPQPTVVISVDLTQQRMTVTEDGVAKYKWPISSGRSGYNTPTGSYRPQWMAKMWHSRKYDDAPMPNSIFFTGGFAIHATFATGMLGRPASHGCVRLAPANAATLFKIVQSRGMDHTRISVFGVPRQSEPAVARHQQDGLSRQAGMNVPPQRLRQAYQQQAYQQQAYQQQAYQQQMQRQQGYGRYPVPQQQPSLLASLFGAKPQPQPRQVVMRAPPQQYGQQPSQRPLYVYTTNGQLVRVR